jgi:phosphatidate cytidylyltransferase
VSTGRRTRYLDDGDDLRAARRARAAQREARRHPEPEPPEPSEIAEPEDFAEPDDEPERPRRPARPVASERRRSGGSELLQRILIAVPLAVIAIIFVDVGGLAFAVLMALVSVLCLVELYRMLERWKPIPVIGYIAAVALTVSIAGTLLGIFWIGLGFAHAELLRELPHGNAIVIDVMVGTFLADTGAYLGGRLFGRRPLAPSISPNKTVEGLGLGMFTAIVAVFIAGRFQQTWLTEGDSLLLGVAVAVLGPLGDLFESVVKRDAGAKDAGTLFGAHGGALDRLDAIIFTVVGGYYVWVGLLH